MISGHLFYFSVKIDSCTIIVDETNHVQTLSFVWNWKAHQRLPFCLFITGLCWLFYENITVRSQYPIQEYWRHNKIHFSISFDDIQSIKYSMQKISVQYSYAFIHELINHQLVCLLPAVILNHVTCMFIYSICFFVWL